VVVIEENHSYGQIIGSVDAPKTNALAARSVSLTNFYATTHPSLPNYISLTSGDTHGITSDCGKCDVDAANIIDQFEQAKVSWHVYAQGYPGKCSGAARAGAYAKKHVPFLYYRSVISNPSVCAKIVGLDKFWTDAKAGSLPAVSFVIPDLDHDMHGVGEGEDPVQVVRRADEVVGRLAAAVEGSPTWKKGSRLVVTWDEGGGGKEPRTSCCGGRSTGGHIATLVAGPDLQPGTDAADHDHYGLLRSIEERYGLEPLGRAADPESTLIRSIASD